MHHVSFRKPELCRDDEDIQPIFDRFGGGRATIEPETTSSVLGPLPPALCAYHGVTPSGGRTRQGRKY